MNQATTIAAYLREKLPFAPDIALVLGSGLGGLAEQIENAVIIPYRSVPGFPVSTAPGHAGQFVAGQLAGKNVLCMQGRFHYYEGHDMAAIALPVRVFKALGCRALVLGFQCRRHHAHHRPHQLYGREPPARHKR